MSITDERPIKPISKVSIKGACNVFIKRGRTSTLKVCGQTERDVKNVRTTCKHETLTIDSVGGTVSISGGSITVRGNGNIVAGNMIVNALGSLFGRDTDVEAYGQVDVYIELPELKKLTLSGSADVEITDLAQDTLTIKVSGAGDIEASGTVNELCIEVSGSGDVDTRELKADQASVSVSGAGDVKVCALQAVDINVSGAGDVKVYDNPPQRSKDVSGAGSVKFK